jgi:hypothetical protein
MVTLARMIVASIAVFFLVLAVRPAHAQRCPAGARRFPEL